MTTRFNDLKQQMFIISQLLCVRNLGVATLLFWLGVFHEFCSQEVSQGCGHLKA